MTIKFVVSIFENVLSLIFIYLLNVIPRAEYQTIRVIWTSDLHAQLLPTADFASPGLPRRKLGGWDNLVKLIQEQRTNSTLLLDCGDFGFGSPEGDSSQGRLPIFLMNRLSYDAVTLGARDFSQGVINIELFAQSAGFPILIDPMINVVLNRQSLLFRPYLVKEVRGVKVGIIGVTDPEIPQLNRAVDVSGLIVDDPVLQVRKYLPAVKAESAEVIVVFGHITLDQGVAIAESLREVNLVICRGEPAYLENPLRVGNSVVAGSGVYGQRIGVADILFHKKKRRVEVVEAQLLNTTPSGNLDSLIQSLLVNQMKEVIAYSEEEFPPNDTGKIKLGFLVAEAVRKLTNADVVILPLSAIEGGLIKGEVSLRELYNVIPYKDRLRLLSIPETLIGKVVAPAGKEGNILCPAVAGADIFVTGDTARWPLVTQVAGLRLRERKSGLYKVVSTELWLEHADLSERGRILPNTLTDLWIKFVMNEKTITSITPPHLYPATPGIAPKSNPELININTATIELLCQLPGIGPKTAEKIIAYRQVKGQFRSVEEIMNVKGIGPKKFEQIKNLITVK